MRMFCRASSGGNCVMDMFSALFVLLALDFVFVLLFALISFSFSPSGTPLRRHAKRVVPAQLFCQ
jgi:hypothetical protein